MAIIHVLDKHTAELIAAGEVVERPASAAKELLENAIDAGATKVTISIEAGGVRLIEVSDNGSGIEAEYISTAFIRHATSKIEHEEDLEHIHTLGFRGEALASIASVARVEVLTKTEQDEFACRYRIEGGEEFPLEAAAHGVGTTIRVRDLFYNTPARMKFLKKDSSEGTFVADIVGHVALSHPEVSFKFVREGKLQYVTPGDGKLVSAAYAVLGREFARGLLDVDEHNGNYYVYGSITPPKSCRASRSMEYFYINGRYVKNRTMMAALESAFKGTTMQGKFPGCVLLLEMPPELVDVNVHPAKTEVRFAHENDVFDVVYHAVKGALAQPGSGERMFTFGATKTAHAGEAKDAADALPKLLQKDGGEREAGGENGGANGISGTAGAEGFAENTLKNGMENEGSQSVSDAENAAHRLGLSAVTARQATPGMLRKGSAETADGAAKKEQSAPFGAENPNAQIVSASFSDLSEDADILQSVIPHDAPIGHRASMASPGFAAAQAFAEPGGYGKIPPLAALGRTPVNESALDIEPEGSEWTEKAQKARGMTSKTETSDVFSQQNTKSAEATLTGRQTSDVLPSTGKAAFPLNERALDIGEVTAADADLYVQAVTPKVTCENVSQDVSQNAAQGAANNAENPAAKSGAAEVQPGAQTSLFAEDGSAPLHYIGELFKTYILAEYGDALCLIDKHAAHERALFEQLSADYGNVPGQLLLAPITVNLSAEEKQAVLENLDLLENAGLEVGDYGGATVIVRTVPADVAPADAEDLLVELADKLAGGSRDALNERTEWVLHSISCRAAIKAGDRTQPAELLALAEKILSGAVPPFCPHGRPCVLKLTRKELEKQFGRIV